MLSTTLRALRAIAVFLGGAPSPRDLPRIDEELRRFGVAMLGCFSAAVVLYLYVITERRLEQQLASLGVAFWVVSFLLMFFVAYYRTQRWMVVGE